MRVAVIEDTANHNNTETSAIHLQTGVEATLPIVVIPRIRLCSDIWQLQKGKRQVSTQGKGKIIESGMPYVQLETQLIGRPIDTAFHTEFRVGVNGFLWDDADWGFEHIHTIDQKSI